jgi:hypothetical protein
MENLVLVNAKRNVYSQNGEDGVIEFLTNLFDIKEGSFCEFGAWDGIHLSNTYNLLENKNWSGVYIEGDHDKYNDLLKLKETYKNKIETIESYVSHEGTNSLDNILKNTSLKKNFDLLSIDVDGMDYHIWEALINYKPKLVIIEVNSHFRPGNNTIQCKETPESGTGSSFTEMCELGIKKGYYPLIHIGNVFFADINFLKEKNYNINLDINSLFTW